MIALLAVLFGIGNNRWHYIDWTKYISDLYWKVSAQMSSNKALQILGTTRSKERKHKLPH